MINTFGPIELACPDCKVYHDGQKGVGTVEPCGKDGCPSKPGGREEGVMRLTPTFVPMVVRDLDNG